MTLERARAVADAVLYEGYVLYPYRASSQKNQVRWQFGVLVPPEQARADPSESSWSQTECLLERSGDAVVHVEVRCLQLQARTVEAIDATGTYRGVASLEVAHTTHIPWDEAVAHEISGSFTLDDLLRGEAEMPIEIAGGRDIEPIEAASGTPHGRIVRDRQTVTGRLRAKGERLDGPVDVVKLRLVTENTTAMITEGPTRDEALARSLLSAHTLVSIEGGAFLSSMDPPEWARRFTEGCENVGTFPVLMGDAGGNDVMLSSRIILSDHPQIAPESPGDLYDGTEIDEILTLRTMALTDDEKREARATDARAAEIIERVDSMPRETLDRLHGAIRSFEDPASAAGSAPPDLTSLGADEGIPWWDPGLDASVSPETDEVLVHGVPVSKGSRVVLRPGHRRADAQDMFLVGRTATVHAVFFDVDGANHVAVTLDDDEAADLHQAHGRFLYFSPEEIEPAPSESQHARVLVAGVGNIFLGDDAFGCQVVARLASEHLPPDVRLEDFGIRGIHLAYELLEGYELVILVDAVPRGGTPGDLYVIEPESDEERTMAHEGSLVDAHGMEPGSVLSLLETMGGNARILVVGCEPADASDRMGLSGPVEAAVGRAVPLIKRLLEDETSVGAAHARAGPRDRTKEEM